MPFHLCGYTESQDSATLVNVAAIADNLIRTQGDDIIVPEGLASIVGLYGLGGNLTRAQINSPSLRGLWLPELNPLDVAAEPSSPTPFLDYRFTPIELVEDEVLNAQAAEDNAAAARATILVWLADGPIQVYDGPSRTVRVTGAGTLTAFTWTNVSLTFDQTLPAGTYQIVGARFRSAGLIAFRFRFIGGAVAPGGIGYDAVTDLDHPAFRYGGMGVWGEFRHNSPPTVDFLSISADTSETGELDLVRVG